MAKTPIFRFVKNILSKETSSFSRRDFLKLGAYSGAALGTMSLLGGCSSEEEKKKPLSKYKSVAIIGGGFAGLTCAYRLLQAGVRPYLFESSSRLGGRVYTQDAFNKEGMFVELGGEFIDTGHEALQSLCKELKIPLESLIHGDKGEDLYYFSKKFKTSHDMIDPKTGKGAFREIAKQIAKDVEKIVDKDDEWTDFGRKLDNISLYDYLEQFRGKAPDWCIELINVAYLCEYGLEIKKQSALNLVYLIGTELNKPFSIFGESDEAWRIKGGNSRLTEALEKILSPEIDISYDYNLIGIAKNDDKTIKCQFIANNTDIERDFDIVIFALPFTKLRKVEGIEEIGLPNDLVDAIKTLGYGTNAKLALETKSRIWREDKTLPTPSNGSFYSDLPFQTSWESSRKQEGSKGILMNYIGGEAGTEEAQSRFELAKRGFEEMLPALKDEWTGHLTSFFWTSYEHNLGSYTCPLVGQYTTHLEVATGAELDGAIYFAGEHTSVDYNGYMNGAVESGERTAKLIIKDLR